MTTFYIFEVMIPEHKKMQFEKLMLDNGIAYRDKKQFRVTNLEKWWNNEQKSIEED